MARVVAAAFGALALAQVTVKAEAAELLMMEQPGCVWCARFDAEIAPTWAKTAEGRRAPLRRVDMTAPWPRDLLGIQRERFTPTFVLLHEVAEVGRLRGYVGDVFFWYRVGELLANLPQENTN
ncbi:transcriptional regulator [Mesorhizobium sp.]|uniref:transcriptional regulator n=1 Tax=Mesorhizobium sp. TaxID=1871066 RepID=UPI00120750DB|nr:transcriptional regulator [Mesorhizobium sp.]TIP10427.1 MAG: transcriptional regulator [Mesorhizobium sp.]